MSAKEMFEKLGYKQEYEIKRKETGIKILEAEIRQLYDFINEVQRLAELETIRIEDRKSKKIY